MSKISKALEYMRTIAADDKHGYSQINRDGNPDFDCSSLVIYCLRTAGFTLKGASYTGNMLEALLKDGFKDITKEVTLTKGTGLKAGDILLTPGKHTAMFSGSKKMIAARHDENGGITGKKPGDQTGKEICEHSYYNYPWKYVLRYTEKAAEPDNIDKLAVEVIAGTYGNGEARKKALGANYEKVQKRVNEYYHVAKLVIKGDYGNGEVRKNNLAKAGYDYGTVQKIVNVTIKTLWKI